MMMLHVVAFIKKQSFHLQYMQAKICKPSDLWRVANYSPTIPVRASLRSCCCEAIKPLVTTEIGIMSESAGLLPGKHEMFTEKICYKTNKALFKHKNAWICLMFLIGWWKQRKPNAIHNPFARNSLNMQFRTSKNKTTKNKPNIFNVGPSGITERRPIFFSSLFLRDSRSATKSSNSWSSPAVTISEGFREGFNHLKGQKSCPCLEMVEIFSIGIFPFPMFIEICQFGNSKNQVIFICPTVCLILQNQPEKMSPYRLQAPASSSREDCYAQQELFPAYLL